MYDICDCNNLLKLALLLQKNVEEYTVATVGLSRAVVVSERT